MKRVCKKTAANQRPATPATTRTAPPPSAKRAKTTRTSRTGRCSNPDSAASATRWSFSPGKGGVGKSTVAVTIAVALQMAGKRVGLLDIDIHGPSIPTMLGLDGQTLQGGANGLLPVDLDGLKVMSLGFLIPDPDQAVIWRGPMKMGVIKQFLKDVDWGDLDYLIIDSPPGTGDEPLSLCQLIGNLDGAVVVTTPQKVAAVDVRKSITFCHQLNVPVLGVVENMSGFVCPKCGEMTPILSAGGGRRISRTWACPFWAPFPSTR